MPFYGDRFTLGTITYKFECSVCNRVLFQGWDFRWGQEARLATLPDGWRDVDRALICPEHAVVLTITTPGPIKPIVTTREL